MCNTDMNTKCTLDSLSFLSILCHLQIKNTFKEVTVGISVLGCTLLYDNYYYTLKQSPAGKQNHRYMCG